MPFALIHILNIIVIIVLSVIKFQITTDLEYLSYLNYYFLIEKNLGLGLVNNLERLTKLKRPVPRPERYITVCRFWTQRLMYVRVIYT